MSNIASSVPPIDRGTVINGALLAPFVIVALGALVLPDLFYDRFVWQYFYGPVVADAQGVQTLTRHGVTVSPGYTLVNEVGYAYTLVVAVKGLLDVLKRFDIGKTPSFFWALVPFVFAGGALRVVEDTGAFDGIVELFIISPIIYGTMAAITGLALIGSIGLEKRGVVDDYTKPLGATGIVFFVILLAFLFWFGITQTLVQLWVLGAVVVSASILTGIVWVGVTKTSDNIPNVLGLIAPMLLWGHLIDGTATSIGIEVLGYGEKHPIVRALIEVAGTAYVFIPVKILLVLGVMHLFADEELFRESPRYAYLFLVAILAVGLGPGMRDVLRVTIGV